MQLSGRRTLVQQIYQLLAILVLHCQTGHFRETFEESAGYVDVLSPFWRFVAADKVQLQLLQRISLHENTG